jgi:hypothetical protein
VIRVNITRKGAVLLVDVFVGHHLVMSRAVNLTEELQVSYAVSDE